MNSYDKINLYYNEYKANYEAAREAERRGNIEGARQLYRQAALDLCNMAELESGETRKQRIYHAEQIMKLANNLTAPKPSAATLPQSGATNAQESIPAEQQAAEDNPWKSEGIPDTSFDDVVGMEDVKELIRSRVIDQIKYPELYDQYGLKGGTGVLLFGLPGTGKTTIARAIAHEINAPLYTVLLSDVLSKWVGESEKLIKQLFDKARSAKTSLIFFDDFDSLGMQRQDDGNHNNKIIVELINQMDGFRKNQNTIVLLAATNKPWLIDSALMRPGRFEHHIYVPLANHDARIMLVKRKLGNVPIEEGLNFNNVSQLLQGYNGADIVSVVNGAKVKALQRSKEMLSRGEQGASPITEEDFEQAAAAHKSSVDPQDVLKLRNYAAQRGIMLPEEL